MSDRERGDDGDEFARHLAEAVGALPFPVDGPHHRRQQQQQHERDVVVADEHVPHAFADEAHETAPRRHLRGLAPYRIGGAHDAGELFLAANRTQQHTL
jgi:hypothetical protein